MNSASYEKNTSTKHNKYVVNQKLEHVEDISFREFFGRIRVVFYKIRFVSSYHRVFCIYIGHSFL
jgi:hypothetical protein